MQINGAGFLAGLDARDATAQQHGTAGLLQQALYVAGLSGGSWAVGSLALNDWPQAEVLANQTWHLGMNLIIPSDDAFSYYADVVGDVAGKRHEGYPTGIVDYWGRALSYHLVNASYDQEGQATTWSDLRNTTSFQSAAYPFPIVIADEREPGALLIHRNTTIFEFNPFEFGSFDPDVQAFVPMEILGSNLDNGKSNASDGQCTYGFDNFGFVVGTSSTLFNSVYSSLVTSDGDSAIKDALKDVLGDVSEQANVRSKAVHAETHSTEFFRPSRTSPPFRTRFRATPAVPATFPLSRWTQSLLSMEERITKMCPSIRSWSQHVASI